MPEAFYLTEIELTAPQREMVEWAADAMVQYWADAEENGIRAIDRAIMMTKSGVVVAADREVLSDLKYRLIEQLPGTCEDEERAVQAGHIRSAENAWDWIQRAADLRELRDIEAR